MRLPRRLLTILTTLLLVMGAFGRVGIAWTCEGRVCSSDLARCCCASASPLQDGSCRGATSVRSGDACANRCGCKAVATRGGPISSVSHAMASPIVHADEVPAALPPTPFVLQAYALLETPQVRAIPPPEPKPSSVSTRRASLRAPPHAVA